MSTCAYINTDGYMYTISPELFWDITLNRTFFILSLRHNGMLELKVVNWRRGQEEYYITQLLTLKIDIDNASKELHKMFLEKIEVECLNKIVNQLKKEIMNLGSYSEFKLYFVQNETKRIGDRFIPNF